MVGNWKNNFEQFHGNYYHDENYFDTLDSYNYFDSNEIFYNDCDNEDYFNSESPYINDLQSDFHIIQDFEQQNEYSAEILENSQSNRFIHRKF